MSETGSENLDGNTIAEPAEIPLNPNGTRELVSTRPSLEAPPPQESFFEGIKSWFRGPKHDNNVRQPTRTNDGVRPFAEYASAERDRQESLLDTTEWLMRQAQENSDSSTHTLFGTTVLLVESMYPALTSEIENMTKPEYQALEAPEEPTKEALNYLLELADEYSRTPHGDTSEDGDELNLASVREFIANRQNPLLRQPA